MAVRDGLAQMSPLDEWTLEHKSKGSKAITAPITGDRAVQAKGVVRLGAWRHDGQTV